jgi:sarcosine oxidase subunit gamma
MAERPHRLSPLAGVVRPGDHGAVGDDGPRLIVTERRRLGLLHLAGPYETAFFDGVRRLAGLDLPREPNSTISVASRTALWTGPGAWLVVSGDDETEALHDGFRAIACAASVAVSDLSHGRAVVRISGPAARDVLAKGCSIDLHGRRFLVGDCAQTSLAGIAILIHAVADDPAFDLYLPRGFAASAWAWLLDAGAEFGCRVEAAA